MKRRKFFNICGLTSILPLLANVSPSTLKSMENKPNILVILVDDLGYGDLSSYGAVDLKTPHIDNLIKAGMRFDNFYANCPVCSPTRASLLTGKFPDFVGVPGVIRTSPSANFGFLNPKAITLPDLFKNAGYQTAIIGKWHLGLESPNIPNERGFDFFHGFLGDMMDDYYDHLRHGNNYMRLNGKVIKTSGHATDLFTNWAIDYLKQAREQEQPFFLYLAYNAPHTPIQPPDAWLERVKKRAIAIDEKRAKLIALIEHLDYNIGKVVETLQNFGLDKNTLIVFSSDNGGQLNVGANNGSLKGGKQNMYEGGIKVPTCVVWRGKINPGSQTQKIALTMDLYPTLCDVAGIRIKHQLDGKSFLPVLLSKSSNWDEERILIWVRREGNKYGGRSYYALRKGKWKLLQNSPFEPMQLYNLSDDPGENNPLDSNLPEYEELFNTLRMHIIESGSIPWQKPSWHQTGNF